MPSHVHPEQQARERIDAMLAESGWMVQSLEELNLYATLGVAVREVRSKGGPADYILFADGKALGVVEAKKEGETLSQVAGQSARYSKAGNWIPRRWADPLPFTYETTGIETNFRDQRDPDSRSRPVFTFHRPETLRDLVTQPDTLRSRLKSLPTLPDSALRECQIRAISHLETSLSENRPRALVQMATGSGKTFTAVSLAYRLIKFGGAKPEEIIKAFRTAPEFRIAVTVDMVATGIDIKPLECLLFLRDVRSQLYFEQMKGRGTRTIDPTDLSAVTPDAGNKTRFVLVDAVGVTESDKTDSRPLERKPTVPFEKLLQQIALGDRDADTLTSLANRLARLDRAISDEDPEELRASGGISLKELASNLLQATDPDKLAELGGQSSPAAAAFVETATKPIAANPGFRQLLEKKRRDQEVTIDHISADDREQYLEAWQSVDSDEAVPLAVAKRAFGGDPRDLIEELNRTLIA